jgi:lysophospholipase L1-like esterase
MRRLVSYALVAILALSGCAAAASQSPKGQLRATQAPGSGDAEVTETPEPTRPAAAPVVMVLGDSYTAGIDGVPPESTYVAEAARTLGWQIVIAGYRGTGFVAKGRIGKTFSALYDAELSWRPAPDMVMVSGGHNDWPYDPRLVAAAAQGLLTTMQKRWPETQLVLTGPLWGGDPSPAALRVRDALKQVASAMGIPFIDPLRERWITGSLRHHTGTAAHYIRPDGVHPNAAGNRYLAGRLVADLRRLGLDRPVLPSGD